MRIAASRPSSFWARAALAGALLALVAVGAAGYALARGGDDDETEERRAAVARYIADVNTTQQASILELEKVSRVYRELKLGPKADPKQQERVEQAEASLQSLRGRLAKLAAPAEARTLRRELLELVDLQVVLADEVAGMVRYLPVEAAENRKLAAATNTLRRRLEEAKTGEGQRDAFVAFRGVLLASAKALRAATAPDVLEPSRTGEIARLEKLASIAQELAQALADAEVEDVDRLFPRFVQTSQSTGTTKAERAAVVAFNKRLSQIADERVDVVEERARLDLSLR
jgi:hypothetical protein